MAKDDKKGFPPLKKAFKFAAKAALWVTFSFVAVGVADFIFFHELVEGQALVEAASPALTSIFRADIPILGASFADGIVGLAGLLGGGGSEAIEVASNAIEATSSTVAPSNQGFFNTP